VAGHATAAVEARTSNRHGKPGGAPRTVSNALDNPANWSVRVGALFGIRIKLHLLFIFGGLFVVASSLRDGTGWTGFGYGAGTLAMLFVIVLVHEFGHCFGARYVGGYAEEILLWPLGGLAYTSPPHNARAHMITAIAGPLVNVVFLAVTAVVLIGWTGQVGSVPWNPFHPFVPAIQAANEVQHWLVIFFTLNLIILLFNLAPVFPLDGGRVLQCILWRRHGFSAATNTACGIGMVGAIVIAVVGILTEEWLFFAIALFGYFTCWQQRQMIKSGFFESDNEFGYDFSRGYTSLDHEETAERKPSYWQRRRTARALKREHREAERLEEHRVEVDRILDKVHREGIESLNPKERRLLEAETARQRSER